MKTCIDCKREMPLSSFSKNGGDKRRPECRECGKARKAIKRSEDPALAKAYDMAFGILKRTKYAVDNPKNKSYKRKGIVSEIGGDTISIRDWLISNFRDDIERLLDAGETPSVDRIDSDGNYAPGNIRIVPLSENTKGAVVPGRPVTVIYPSGDSKEFPTVAKAARELGVKRDTIYSGAKNPGTNRKGFEFIL